MPERRRPSPRELVRWLQQRPRGATMADIEDHWHISRTGAGNSIADARASGVRIDCDIRVRKFPRYRVAAEVDVDAIVERLRVPMDQQTAWKLRVARDAKRAAKLREMGTQPMPDFTGGDDWPVVQRIVPAAGAPEVATTGARSVFELVCST